MEGVVVEMPQWLVNMLNLAGLAAIGVGGWFMRVLYDSQANLAKEIQRVELRVVQDYMPRVAVEQKLDMLFSKLDRIEDKLDRKMDKVGGG